MTTSHELANEFYSIIKAQNPEVPPFSFQIIEDDHFNNRLVISNETVENAPRYYGDTLERVKLSIALISDKSSHRKQLELIRSIVNICEATWQTPSFEILQKWMNSVQVFQNDDGAHYWFQIEPVRFNQESQEYAFNIEVLMTRKEKTNV
ncbi:hypothetical protein NXS15_01195 [Mycoplasma sp. CSL7475-4]|uniref:hypothetical protein n=1 Tax=Mycoplasma sp. CSL7475-4 TaxID=2973942 RepID=UPI00216AEF35|nr:hypothetical protein [Mycoplasma sp. CSL7475-4]MCS4536746.1 hypothetical protein [Mycoplasma sp. CSL7475-4]